MTVKVYRDEDGKLMVKGAPAGAWAIWVFAVLVMIVNIPITFVSPVAGIIIFVVMSLLFYLGKKHAQNARIKASRIAMQTEQKENNRFTN